MPEKHCPVCGSLSRYCGHRSEPAVPQIKQDYERRITELEAHVAALEKPLFLDTSRRPATSQNPGLRSSRPSLSTKAATAHHCPTAMPTAPLEVPF